MAALDKTVSTLSVPVHPGGQQMHVRLYGAGSPVLLLHGGGPGTTGEAWHDFIRASASDCQFIAPDFLGFGSSDPPVGAYSQIQILDSVVRLIGLMNLRNICVVGHSMGAAIAIELTISQPHMVNKLVLIAPGGGSYGLNYRSAGVEQLQRCAQDPNRVNVADLVSLMSHKEKSWQAQVDSRMKVIEQPGVMATQQCLLLSRMSPHKIDLNDTGRLLTIKSISIPVALFWGEFEKFNPFEIGQKIHSLLPKASFFEVVGGAGHNVHYDEPERSAQLFDSFFKKIL